MKKELEFVLSDSVCYLSEGCAYVWLHWVVCHSDAACAIARLCCS